VNPSIDIHNIGDRFKRVKGDAYREDQFYPMNVANSDGPKKSIYILNEKVGVLKVDQQTKVDADRRCKQHPAFPYTIRLVHPFNQVKVDKGRSQNDEDEFGAPHA
jgi:hypothetical protein